MKYVIPICVASAQFIQQLFKQVRMRFPVDSLRKNLRCFVFDSFLLLCNTFIVCFDCLYALLQVKFLVVFLPWSHAFIHLSFFLSSFLIALFHSFSHSLKRHQQCVFLLHLCCSLVYTSTITTTSLWTMPCSCSLHFNLFVTLLADLALLRE